ncbi:transcriptional repressor [Candidatus Poribacteria bacterium]|nr:transcriptional repressor [Candidatus Poribacteria bacterium]
MIILTEKAKTRTTRQQRAILEELRNSDSHPTADEIYDKVRQQIPRISLGTVYRNLDSMSESGIIQKLELGGGQKRFDGRNDKHYHFRCCSCGRVFDLQIDQKNITDMIKNICDKCEHMVEDHYLLFTGICSDCKKNE